MNCRMGLTRIIREAWSGILTVPKQVKVLVLVYMNGTQIGHRFSVGLHTMVFQAEILRPVIISR